MKLVNESSYVQGFELLAIILACRRPCELRRRRLEILAAMLGARA